MCAVFFLTGCALHHRVESFEGSDSGVPDTSIEVDAEVPFEPLRCALRRVDNVQVGGARYQRYAPDLVFDGTSFQVIATESDSDAHPWVSVTTVSRDLRDVSETRFAGEETHSWGLGSRLSDGAIALAWSGDPGGPSRLMYRRLEGEDRTARIDLYDNNTEAVLDLATIEDTSLVAYRYRTEVDGEFRIESRYHLIDRHGNALIDPVTLHVTEYPGRTIRMATMGEHFIAAIPHEEEIEVRRIDVRGRVVDTLRVDAPDVRHVVVAANEERMALVWRTGPRDARNIIFQAFDSDFRALADSRQLETAAPGAAVPAVAALPSGWVVLWGEGRYNERSVLLNVDPTGEPFEARHEFVGGSASSYGAPALEVVDGELFIAVSHEPAEGEAETIFVQRWVCEEDPVLCEPQNIPADGCDETFLGWRWDGNGCTPAFGCACEGSDCGQLATTEYACLHDHGSCPTTCPRPEPKEASTMCVDALQHNAYGTAIVWAQVEGADCCTPCRANVVGAYAIELEFEQCVLCDCAPNPRGVACRLPPMGAGDWTVRSAAGEITLQVVPRWEELPAPEGACVGS